MINERKGKEIEKIVFDALTNSKSLGVFPTPVEKIIQYANLRVSSGIDLSEVSNNYIARSGILLKKGISKIRGALDRRERKIYLDLKQPEVKKRFVKLHETGHELCSWQGKLLDFLDNDETLDPDINDEFEAEANFFASASLFQLGVFNDKMADLPLELESAIQLSRIFGSSVHASLRRYVEKSQKKCALLVINVDKLRNILTIRNYFQSPKFSKEIGEIIWNSELDINMPFVQDYLFNRKFYKNEISIKIGKESIDCNYHFFNNGYNIFVLIFPKGEKIKSRTKFIVSV